MRVTDVDMDAALDQLELVPQRGKVECPRHVDNTGSLHIYEDHGYCFSCGWNGDAYGLIALFTNQDVRDVLKANGGTEKRSRASAHSAQKVQTSANRRLLAMSDTFWTVVLPFLDDVPQEAFFSHIDHWSNLFQEATHDIYGLAPFEADMYLDRFQETLDYAMDTFPTIRRLRKAYRSDE